MKSLANPSTLACLTLAALLLGAHGSALAQPAPTADAALYNAFGQKAGLVRLTDNFVNRLTADQRINAMFKESNIRRVKEKIAEQLCVVTGGPCTYTGDTMKEVHGNLGIRMKDFNALVEDLQDAMDEAGVAFSDQNRLLALLAPMYRDMVKP